MLLYLGISLSACGGKRGDTVVTAIDSLNFQTLTTGVNTLVSDSGVTKYKLIAEKWYTFDIPEKKWYFPEGIYVEQFDTLLTIQASIKADTAYYYEDRQLWHLIGNVHVMNREGQNFYSNSLFWDQGQEEVYSHEYIKIIKSEGELLEGHNGFKSNQSMTKYTIYSSSGHMDVEDKIDTGTKDTLPPILPPPPPSAGKQIITDTLSLNRP